MNLHIMEDNKFYGEMIAEILHQGLQSNNKFAVKYYKNNTKLIHIGTHTKRYTNIEIIDKSYSLAKLSKGYDKVFFHSLRTEDIRKLSSYKKPVNQSIYWRQWTSDTFDFERIANFRNFKIKHHRLKGLNKSSGIGRYLNLGFNFGIKSMLWGRELIRYPKVHRALSKIDFVGNWNSFEAKNLQKLYPKFKAKFVFLQYTNDAMQQPVIHNKGNTSYISVMLGHSGFPDNYHKEMLNFLAALKSEYNIKVYVPLSYGFDDYIAEVLDYGRNKLGDDFVPLLDFMKKVDYYQLLSEIDAFIFNNDKPIAAANIFTILAMGKKLFLRKDNPMFHEFITQGIKLFTVESLIDQPSLLNNELSEEEKNTNNAFFTGSSRKEMYRQSMKIFIE